MHYHHPSFKVFSVCLTLVFAAFAFVIPHQLEASDTNDKVVVKQEVKKTKVKKHKKKEAEKQEAEKLAAAKKEEEEKKAAEAKKQEQKPPPPPVVTPDKKKYASPNGYQVMTDGTVINFRSMGVIYMHGYRYTYYSSNVLRHHRTHEWYACDDHIYRTKEGYVVVASGKHPQGSIVPTPFGPGKVLDHCHVNGTIDIYVDF